MKASLREPRRLHLRPLPLRERATQRTNDDEWVRGTPHPIEFIEMAEWPSPSRGEGAATLIATRGQTGPR
jgi:hypothetical protein